MADDLIQGGIGAQQVPSNFEADDADNFEEVSDEPPAVVVAN